MSLLTKAITKKIYDSHGDMMGKGSDSRGDTVAPGASTDSAGDTVPGAPSAPSGPKPKFGSPEFRAMYPRKAKAPASGSMMGGGMMGAGAPPGGSDMGEPSPMASADPQDVQTISDAAKSDPVIAAIARVLGIA